MRTVFATGFLFFTVTTLALGQIPKPDDAPLPLSPEEAVKQFRLPPGLHMELAASEPLIREPSGVCWDEHGHLFVCELHGFNLDGQIDIDELNKTGKLDKVVRRFFVPEEIEKEALAGTYGTVKRLTDRDGDGRMDHMDVWADHLPACFGLCAARGGVIVVCAPDIIFLADRDGDGQAEVREVLFTGFATGVLDRRMGDPKWGLDDWIYIGRPHRDALITGPHLPKPVQMPDTDFRIKADGSAIEPVSGAVGGLGMTFTESGDRFISSIGWPAHFVAPLPWQSLARNPYVVTPDLMVQVFPDRRVYPTSKAHPWRTKRADDPGFAKYYTDGWGIAESAPNGYFTSCCAPLIYQDDRLPGLRGQLLACEPAQNLIHRSVVERDELLLKLRRQAGEETSEFLTTNDSWFHPIALSHGPDGNLWITDFYREIIEDYSAIPRYLQQQYGLTNGKDHGRIWKIVSDSAPVAPAADMSHLTANELASEVGSSLYWRRETARRLLVERKLTTAAPKLVAIAASAQQPAAVINAAQTLEALDQLPNELLVKLLSHDNGGVRRQALQLAERRLATNRDLTNAALRLADDTESYVRLQLAFTLGATPDGRVLTTLANLARKYGNELWMRSAILSSLAGRGTELLSELTLSTSTIGAAGDLLEPLCASISARRQPQELSTALIQISSIQDIAVQTTCLQGIRKSFGTSTAVNVNEDARRAVKQMSVGNTPNVSALALSLIRLMRLEAPAEREARLTDGVRKLNDATMNTDDRLSVIAELSAEDDAVIAPALAAGLPSATPRSSRSDSECHFLSPRSNSRAAGRD